MNVVRIELVQYEHREEAVKVVEDILADGEVHYDSGRGYVSAAVRSVTIEVVPEV